MIHDVILSPKIYNVCDQYDVYMNIPLSPPPPLGVLVGDGTKVDCAIDKRERW